MARKSIAQNCFPQITYHSWPLRWMEAGAPPHWSVFGSHSQRFLLSLVTKTNYLPFCKPEWPIFYHSIHRGWVIVTSVRFYVVKCPIWFDSGSFDQYKRLIVTSSDRYIQWSLHPVIVACMLHCIHEVAWLVQVLFLSVVRLLLFMLLVLRTV